MLEQLTSASLSVQRIAQADHIYLRRQPQDCLNLIARWQAKSGLEEKIKGAKSKGPGSIYFFC